MRVIAGTAKGRKLKTLAGISIRPTSDKVKEALFSILANLVFDSMFLDVYAGAGGIGIEALSRGCKKAFFVEKNPVAIRCIRYNLEVTRLNDKAQIICMTAPKALSLLDSRFEKFDIIFLDPPYALEFPEKDILAAGKLLNKGGLLVLESDKKRKAENAIGNLTLTREKYYGDTKLIFYI